MINSPPKVMRLAVDFHKDLIQMPLPVGVRAHPVGSISPDLGCKHRAKSVPPEPNRFVTDFDATLVQQILNIP